MKTIVKKLLSSKTNYLQKIFKKLWGGGEDKLKYINIIGLSFIPIYNLIIFVSQDVNLLEKIPYLLPFVIMIVLVAVTKGNKYVVAMVYLFIALGTTIDPVNVTDYSGAIFFSFSYHQIKNKKYGILILSITAISLTIRSISYDDTIPQTIEMMAAFAFVYALYYYLNINNNDKILKEARTIVCFGNNSREANPINVDIMRLRVLGYELNKCSDILRLNITDGAMSARLSRERKKLGLKTPEAYLYWLMSEPCKIEHNIDKATIGEDRYDMINQFDS